MLNKFSLWKNLFLLFIVIIAVIYALPNLYGEDPAVQIEGNSSKSVIDAAFENKISAALISAGITPKSISLQQDSVLVRFLSTDDQFKGLAVVRATVGNGYTSAVNLAPATPAWLQAINANPMKKGLDLQGGIHFLLDVDVPSAVSKRLQSMVQEMSDDLRTADLRYDSIARQNQTITIGFRDVATANKALSLLEQDFAGLTFIQQQNNNQFQIIATVTPAFIENIREYTLDQTLTTLRNRVNELGISEPVVQQQGANQISVDLPGVQDSAQARQILGGTATLEFHMVDNSHDLNSVISSGVTPPGTRLYYFSNGQPILLQSAIVLSGNSITSASSNFDENGQPAVSITIGGAGVSYFSRTTQQNIGNQMGIVYIESKPMTKIVDGKPVRYYVKQEHVISAPVIQSALPSQFQIVGITDAKEAQNLALLLRAGAMPVNVDIVEERTVGASLGVQNIKNGMLSVEVAFLLIVIFMALYYQVFGIIADLALTFNLLLILALLSILGATLSLPGIAGIVLTVGMAVDANVLIFERIREELRNGMSPQASIHAGFERAFATIVDANVTTLIVALVLFSIGSGPIKGFAVTLSVGILTSMFSAITFTRGLVNLIYGGKAGRKLAIGIKLNNKTQVKK